MNPTSALTLTRRAPDSPSPGASGIHQDDVDVDVKYQLQEGRPAGRPAQRTNKKASESVVKGRAASRTARGEVTPENPPRLPSGRLEPSLRSRPE